MMSNQLLTSAAIAAIVFQLGCSGGAPQQAPSDASDSPTTVTQDSVSVEEPTGMDSDSGVVDNYAVSDVSTDAGSDCNGKTCDAGEACIEYVGYAGNRLVTCGIPCKSGAPNDGCPEDMHCQVIPDGPTQCVK